MQCPSCNSNRLILREATGIERLILLFITHRQYRCRDCQTRFRAPDRRLTKRTDVDIETPGLSVTGRIEP